MVKKLKNLFLVGLFFGLVSHKAEAFSMRSFSYQNIATFFTTVQNVLNKKNMTAYDFVKKNPRECMAACVVSVFFAMVLFGPSKVPTEEEKNQRPVRFKDRWLDERVVECNQPQKAARNFDDQHVDGVWKYDPDFFEYTIF